MTVLENKLRLALGRALKAKKIKNGRVEIFLLKKRDMEKLRERLRGFSWFKGDEALKISREESVNVLAFEESARFPRPESSGKFLGEIYLNMGYKRGRYGDLGPLLVHGFLHLLGYRHGGESDRIKMEKEEKRLWRVVKI